MIEIRATYSWRKGTAPCTRCPENIDNVDIIVAYDEQKTLDDAEKLIYSNVFVHEMNLQNQKYKRKSNFSRMMDIDEWRASPRHRPCEYLLQIGNKQYHPPIRFLWDAYREFYKWRRETFPDLFIFIGAAVYSGCTVPHIHERIVFYYKDGDVIKTGIEKSLQKAGIIELPYPKMKEDRYNNRKITFTDMCREKWLDIVEDKLKIFYPEIKLVRPKPKSKPIIKLDRALRLELGSHQTLVNAEKRQQAKIEALKSTGIDLRKKQQTVCDELDAGDISKERRVELKEQALILKNKLKQNSRRMENAQRKAESIRANLAGR